MKYAGSLTTKKALGPRIQDLDFYLKKKKGIQDLDVYRVNGLMDSNKERVLAFSLSKLILIK